jgi:glycosyltransferase involved in cell wall biosynthesis
VRLGIDARELQGRPTGVGRYLRNLLQAWPALGDELLLYFNGRPPDDLPRPDASTLEVRAVGPARRGLVWQEGLLPRVVAADGVDAFFAPAYACPLRLRRPRVTTVHDLSFYSLPSDFTPRDGLRRRLTVAASIRASRRLLVPSDFSRREVAARFPEAEPRLRVTPEAPAADLPPGPAREEARRQLGVQGPLLLTVGAILNRRRLPTLLRAAALLSRRWPRLRLDVVGENRTHPQLDLEARARAHGVAEAVRLTGHIPDLDLAARYAAADAFVYLSDYEGFGLPVLEAMARGLPVVLADRPCLSEVHAEAALAVDPRDEQAVAAALHRVLAEPSLSEDLARRGRAHAARFTWTEAARLTREALAEAAS